MSHSPSYPNHSRNPRLYQHLMTSNYLHQQLYNPQAPATIRFRQPPEDPNRPRYSHNTHHSTTNQHNTTVQPFHTIAQSFKTSHQATQSLGSNYSIMQMDNESYSTINLYSLSRHHIEPDLSISSNNITAKINHDLTNNPNPQHSKQSDLMLEGSTNRQAPTLQEVSYLEQEDEKLKKYKSEEWKPNDTLPPNQTPQHTEDDVQSPLPRLLADRYLRNDLNRKFTGSEISDKDNDPNACFKPILNQIHVVPYKINESVQPYAFSLPINQERRGKATSLKLHNSRNWDSHQEPNQPPIYLSNHTHLSQHRPSPLITSSPNNRGAPRIPPKSEPKVTTHHHHHLSNQKTSRSNSIGCKNKPNLVKIEQPQAQISRQDEFDQSRVIRMFRQDEQIEVRGTSLLDNSVWEDENSIGLCCGYRGNGVVANRINFIEKEDGYKINPLADIKGREAEIQRDKKGLKLVGFNSSFSRRSGE